MYIYIYMDLCVHCCVEVSVDRILVSMQQVCSELVFELGHHWIEDYDDAIKIHFVHAQHSCHHTAFVAEIYEHRLLKCVFVRFFLANNQPRIVVYWRGISLAYGKTGA